MKYFHFYEMFPYFSNLFTCNLASEMKDSRRNITAFGMNTDKSSLTENNRPMTVKTLVAVRVCPVITYVVNITRLAKGIIPRYREEFKALALFACLMTEDSFL